MHHQDLMEVHAVSHSWIENLKVSSLNRWGIWMTSHHYCPGKGHRLWLGKMEVSAHHNWIDTVLYFPSGKDYLQGKQPVSTKRNYTPSTCYVNPSTPEGCQPSSRSLPTLGCSISTQGPSTISGRFEQTSISDLKCNDATNPGHQGEDQLCFQRNTGS